MKHTAKYVCLNAPVFQRGKIRHPIRRPCVYIVNGLRLIAALYRSRCANSLMGELGYPAVLRAEECREAGLTPLGKYFHQIRDELERLPVEV